MPIPISPRFWFACAAIAAPGLAFAGTGILETQAGFKPTVSLSESFSEKVYRVATDQEGGTQYQAVATHRVAAKIVASLRSIPDDSGNLVDFDFSTLSEDTPVELEIGDYKFSSTLGANQGAWSAANPTGTRAQYDLGYAVPVLNSDGTPATDASGNPVTRFKQTGRIRFEWSQRTGLLLILLEERIAAPELPEGKSGFAANRLTDSLELGAQRFANQPIPVRIQFGQFTGTRLSYSKGIRQAVPHRLLPPTNSLRSVGLAAAADNSAPKFTRFTGSSAPDSVEFSFSGTLIDRGAPTFPALFEIPEAESLKPSLRVHVNDEGMLDASGNFIPGFPVETLGSGGTTTFTGSCILAQAVNILRFVATDADGNTSTLVRKVRANAGAVQNGSAGITITGSGVLVLGPGQGSGGTLVTPPNNSSTLNLVGGDQGPGGTLATTPNNGSIVTGSSSGFNLSTGGLILGGTASDPSSGPRLNLSTGARPPGSNSDQQ